MLIFHIYDVIVHLKLCYTYSRIFLFMKYSYFICV